ncbi:magnesium transporter NIPA-domain-containing protein [Mycena rebaudengoi]|nr:magnesium transporter NIPA-domain-containing protein [Mycena rebaudengoi]
MGLALAVSSSVCIGGSVVLTKRGLNASANGTAASDNLTYLRNPIWWAGMSTLANFAAYTFAPPVLVTPLARSLHLFFLMNEWDTSDGWGCALCLLGSVIIVLHAPEDREINTINDFLNFALKTGFLFYCFTVCVVSLVLAYYAAPKYGRKNPVVYIGIASLVGSISVMFLTFGGKNQFIYPSTYIFGLISATCIVIQLNYYNKALDSFSVNLVNPLATIVASLILFEGFDTTDATNTFSLVCGFIVTFLGVHVLNLSMLEESAIQADDLETGGGVTLEGRLSIDGWHGIRRDPPLTPRSAHGRRSSLYRAQDHASGENVGLSRLREEDDGQALRAPVVENGRVGRSPIGSPFRPAHSPGHMSMGDIRISPRPV